MDIDRGLALLGMFFGSPCYNKTKETKRKP